MAAVGRLLPSKTTAGTQSKLLNPSGDKYNLDLKFRPRHLEVKDKATGFSILNL